MLRITKKDKTTKEDKLLIKITIHRYIRNSRTTILAIVVINVNVSITKIFNVVVEVDQTR
jgi:hypothetical protein